jgi:hypothetical protein
VTTRGDIFLSTFCTSELGSLLGFIHDAFKRFTFGTPLVVVDGVILYNPHLNLTRPANTLVGRSNAGNRRDSRFVGTTLSAHDTHFGTIPNCLMTIVGIVCNLFKRRRRRSKCNLVLGRCAVKEARIPSTIVYGECQHGQWKRLMHKANINVCTYLERVRR